MLISKWAGTSACLARAAERQMSTGRAQLDLDDGRRRYLATSEQRNVATRCRNDERVDLVAGANHDFESGHRLRANPAHRTYQTRLAVSAYRHPRELCAWLVLLNLAVGPPCDRGEQILDERVTLLRIETVEPFSHDGPDFVRLCFEEIQNVRQRP